LAPKAADDELIDPSDEGSVDFDKGLSPRARGRKREPCVAQVDFVLRDTVPNGFIRVNSLGIQITDVRVDQASEEPCHD
jgi:hypothetical protein